MGKHILKCECGKEHDISEMFGRSVMDWIEENKKDEELDEEDAFDECYDEAVEEYLKSLGKKNTWWSRFKLVMSLSDEYRVLAAVKYYKKYDKHVVDTDIDMKEVKRRIKDERD